MSLIGGYLIRFDQSGSSSQGLISFNVMASDQNSADFRRMRSNGNLALLTRLLTMVAHLIQYMEWVCVRGGVNRARLPFLLIQLYRWFYFSLHAMLLSISLIYSQDQKALKVSGTHSAYSEEFPVSTVMQRL